MSNLSLLVALSLLSIFIVVLIVSTLGAPFGLEVVHSPLLITLTANILVTELIAIFTAVTAERENDAQERRAQKKAASTFIFANALSALAVLTNSFMETVELSKVTAENGLSLLLEVWIDRELDLFVEVYRNVLGGIMLVAIIVALRGAALIASMENSRDAPPVPSIFLSLILMILGALIGTHWQEVPFESRQIMGTWGSIVTWGTALALLIFTLIASAVITLATIRTISLSIFGVVREGQRVVGSGISFVLGLVSWEVFKGTLVGVVLILGLIAAYNVTTFLIVSLVGTVAESEINSIAAVLIRLNSLSLPLIQKWAFYLAAIAVFGSALAFLAPGIARAGTAMVKSFRKYGGAVFVTLGAALQNASKVRISGIRLRRPTRAQLFEAASGFGKIIRAAAGRTPSIGLQRWAPVLIVCSLVGSSSFVTERTQDSKIDVSSVESSEIESAAIEPGAAPFFKRVIVILNDLQKTSDDNDPVVEPKIGWEIQALRVCDTVYIAPEWQIGSSKALEVPLFSCRLSTAARQSDGILVVVGAASYEPNSVRIEREIARAKDRGAALADWAADQVSSSQTILVLNLGMAKSDTRRRPANSILASLINDRPATALLIRPPVAGSAVSEDEALLRLYELLNEESFLDDFTNCELFRFDRLERRLDTQSQFVCEVGE